MKTNEELKKTAGVLIQSDIERLTATIKDIQHLIDNPDIDEDAWNIISGIANEMRLMEKAYARRLIALMKQNHMLI